MASAHAEAEPSIVETHDVQGNNMLHSVSTWSSSDVKPHPETEAILRQVEYYFSDENLPYDAHLLARTGGDGNVPISINEILGFKRMRRFKPPAQVKASLRLSKVLEVIDNKQIKRKYPLTLPLMVQPKLAAGRQGENPNIKKTLEAKPWLTKAMLKPTGFEEYATEGPIRPSEYEEDRKLYDPEESFISRIEIAVSRYVTKRKMHSHTHNIFVQFLKFGGFATSQRQFGGGSSDKTSAENDEDPRTKIHSIYEVADMVIDGIDEDNGEGSTVWTVDFITTAQAFLSSRLLYLMDWNDADMVRTSVNVPRNFYNFLLLHDVCPEYRHQIIEARKYCDIADEELTRLGKLDHMLPGDFSVACSILFADKASRLHSKPGVDTDWQPDKSVMLEARAVSVFASVVRAFGTVDQIEAVKNHTARETRPKVIRKETIGIEVIEMQMLGSNDLRLNDELNPEMTRSLGKLVCKRWKVPHAPPQDLPPSVVAQRKARMMETLEFLINEDALKLLTVGVKMEVVVKTIDLGFSWIDVIFAIYPTFFTWIDNEKALERKASGPPSEWMERRNEMERAARQEDLAATASANDVSEGLEALD